MDAGCGRPLGLVQRASLDSRVRCRGGSMHSVLA